MSYGKKTRKTRWLFGVALIALLAGGGLARTPAAAAELDKLDTSLKLVPENAAFYSTMLRNREQYDAVVSSKAWKRIMDMPVVKMGLEQYKALANDKGSVPGIIEETLKEPEVIKIVDMLRDMGSQEIFMAGDEGFIQSLELMQQVYSAMNYGPMVAQISGSPAVGDPTIQIKMMISALSANADLIKVPNLVIGFKLKDKAAAKERLKDLEENATGFLDIIPQLEGKLKRTKVGDSEYLVLSLDGSMIPWEEIPMDQLKEMEGEKGSAQKIIDRVKKMKMAISIGLREDYLLVGIGPSTDYLAKLGSGKHLSDRAELKPLAKFADKRLTGISYVSKPMVERLSNTKKDIDDLVELANELLPKASISDELKTRIKKDIVAVAKDIKNLIPEPGAMMAFSFISDSGLHEGYQYNWTEQKQLDGSKALSLLEHLGGDPLIAAVGRGKVSVSNYDMLVKWFNMGYGYFEEFALPTMSETERKSAESFLKDMKPLAKRFDGATRDLLIPSLADGQSALIIDSHMESDQYIKSLPKTPKPMPMLEPAIVAGVSNAESLRKAFSEYREVINGTIDTIRKIEGSQVPPDLKMPEPKVSDIKAGTLFTYTLPADWGLDSRIAPNFGLSKTVGVFSLTQAQTELTLSATPLKPGILLSKPDRQLAGVTIVNVAGLLDKAAPWVNLAAEEAMQNQGIEGSDKTEALAQVQTVMDVLKVFRRITSEVYMEDGATVTHSLAEIKDIEK
jgi:hypothetical protein